MKKLIVIVSTLFIISCNKTEEIQPIRKDIKELVFASGQIEWKDPYNLTAQTDGILQKANYEVGQEVKKGNAIAFLNNPINTINANTAEKQLDIASNNVTDNAPALLQLQENIGIAKTKYAQDKKQAERYQRLHEQNIGSQVEYENAQLNAKNSKATILALEKQYAVLQQQAKQQYISSKGQAASNTVLQNYNVISVPESGTIIKKLKNNGDYIKKGDVLAIIANSKKMEIVLNVDENSIGKVAIGQSVWIQLNTNKANLIEGKISDILAAFDVPSQSFICKVTLNTPLQKSWNGTPLEANIVVGEKKNALLIPRNYVGFGNKVHVKGKAENVIITPGIISTEYVEVLQGISEKDILLPLKP